MRNRLRLLGGLLQIVLLSTAGFYAPASEEPATNCCRNLTVILYPFLPAKADYFFQIQHDFEAANKDVKLEIIDLSSNYYDPSSYGYVVTNEGDVYELDSVLLADVIAQNRIQPISGKMPIIADDYLKNAQTAAQWNGEWYGIPHWVCGYFLFFKSDDSNAPAFRNLKDLTGLEQIVGTHHSSGNGLLIDLMGRLGLGELYLSAAFDRYSDWEHVRPHLLNDQHPEADIESDLLRLRKLCDPNLGRSSRYHYADGFYGKQFALEHGRAMVGYSESLFSVLDEEANACQSNDCLTAQIDVAQVPLDDHGLRQISWVDLLAIDRKCAGDKLRDAIAFIQFVNQEDVMLKALKPDANASRPPRYLLPAKASLYSNQELTNAAPLYPKLRGIIETSFPPVGTNINPVLRGYGGEINKYLTKHESP